MNAGFVYFIRPIGLDAPIKIGHSTYPVERLKTLAVWSPFPLEIVAVVPGTVDLEASLHTMFAEWHSHKEWFRGNKKLLELINGLQDGHHISDLIDHRFVEAGVIGEQKNTATRLHRVFKAYGGAAALARRLGISRNAIFHWQKTDRIPADRVEVIAQLTSIPRHELRPDLYPAPSNSEAAA